MVDLAPGEVTDGDVAHEGDEMVLAQAAGRLRGLEDQLGDYLNISMSFTTTISSVGSLKTAFWGGVLDIKHTEDRSP